MTSCGCQRSFGVVCGILAAIGAALLLAGEQCTRAGGLLSDSAWVCASDGTVTLLWTYVTPGIAALAASAGIVAYFAAYALARLRASA
jgi:hypothetical protein